MKKRSGKISKNMVLCFGSRWNHCWNISLTKTSDKNYQEIFEGSWEKADAPYTTIHRIALADAFRGQKLAYRLVEYAEAETKALGMAQVRVDTHKRILVCNVSWLIVGLSYVVSSMSTMR